MADTPVLSYAVDWRSGWGALGHRGISDAEFIPECNENIVFRRNWIKGDE
jgi:hypothetical protein